MRVRALERRENHGRQENKGGQLYSLGKFTGIVGVSGLGEIEGKRGAEFPQACITGKTGGIVK